MRAIWYGDNGDLVKWGALVHLARERRIGRIIQVPFDLGPQPGERPRLTSDHKTWEFPEEVWLHFRDPRDIRRLERRAGLRIQYLSAIGRHRSREDYLHFVVAQVTTHRGRKMVFLDPDTGIEPTRPNNTHVLCQEVTRLWCVLSAGDLLVLYQHLRRGDKAWKEHVGRQFAEACQEAPVRMVVGQRRDVALFWAVRP